MIDKKSHRKILSIRCVVNLALPLSKENLFLNGKLLFMIKSYLSIDIFGKLLNKRMNKYKFYGWPEISFKLLKI